MIEKATGICEAENPGCFPLLKAWQLRSVVIWAAYGAYLNELES